MLVNLLCSTIFSQQSSQDSHLSYPNHLGRQSGFLRTSSLSWSSVSSFSFGFQLPSHSCSRMNLLWFPYHKTIFDEFSYVLAFFTRVSVNKVAKHTWVRHRNLVDFIWIQPDLSLAAFEHTGGQTFLKTKRDHFQSSPFDAATLFCLCDRGNLVPGLVWTIGNLSLLQARSKITVSALSVVVQAVLSSVRSMKVRSLIMALFTKNWKDNSAYDATNLIHERVHLHARTTGLPAVNSERTAAQARTREEDSHMDCRPFNESHDLEQ